MATMSCTMSYYVMYYVILCHTMSYYVILCHTMSYYVILWHVLCHTMLCTMPYYVILCHTMSYYVILCHDCEDYPQYAETDKHQSGQVDIPKYNEELIPQQWVCSISNDQCHMIVCVSKVCVQC